MRLKTPLGFLFTLFIVTGVPTWVSAGSPVPSYLGSAVCADCHTSVSQEWANSHHALAWQMPDEQTVLGNFDDAIFEHQGVSSRFNQSGELFIVTTDKPDGTTTSFEVQGVAGVEPLQQYLVATETGRLQALDIAWDVDRQVWYHLYPEQDLRAGDGLHWTGPYKNWNARCAECHATGYAKNYDHQTRLYASEQVEVGVGCEACHGPGEAHVKWAKAPDRDDEYLWTGLNASGFLIGFTPESPDTEIHQCAGCHARREPLGDGNPLPGTTFYDAYRLALLRDGLYHADGSIQDEVYVYGSFLQSKMYARGVRCTNCHEAHTANLKSQGNALCIQCHSAVGNPQFQSLKLATYDDPSHHFHDAESAGAQCKNCHMVERIYMGIDGRRDHGFRIPRPDLSVEIGTPNACNDCHTDESADWAAIKIKEWFPDSIRRTVSFAQTFATARSDPGSVTDELLEISENQQQSGIVRASALQLLRDVSSVSIAARATPLIGDDDPLVRSAAIALQRGATPIDRIQRLVAALEDPVQSVRISAVRALLGEQIAHLPPNIATAHRTAMNEWRSSFMAKTDFPETHMAIGGMALVLRDSRAAEQAFREAVRLDPQLVDAWNMIVRIRAVVGDRDGARAALDDAILANPSNGFLLSLKEEF